MDRVAIGELLKVEIFEDDEKVLDTDGKNKDLVSLLHLEEGHK